MDRDGRKEKTLKKKKGHENEGASTTRHEGRHTYTHISPNTTSGVSALGSLFVTGIASTTSLVEVFEPLEPYRPPARTNEMRARRGKREREPIDRWLQACRGRHVQVESEDD